MKDPRQFTEVYTEDYGKTWIDDAAVIVDFDKVSVIRQRPNNVMLLEIITAATCYTIYVRGTIAAEAIVYSSDAPF